MVTETVDGVTYSKKSHQHSNGSAIANDVSAYFPDGSNIVRIEKLPWTSLKKGDFDLAGSIFKLLAIDWDRDMFQMLLIVPGGVDLPPHYHVETASGYIMSGWFRYESGTIFGGEYTMEVGNTQHTAEIGEEDILQLSTIFGGLCGVAENGGPDLAGFIGCKEMYRLAAANNAAAHIVPPPPGWRSKYEID